MGILLMYCMTFRMVAYLFSMSQWSVVVQGTTRRLGLIAGLRKSHMRHATEQIFEVGMREQEVAVVS